jgi:hypothetical protein
MDINKLKRRRGGVGHKLNLIPDHDIIAVFSPNQTFSLIPRS